jgi:uncharacterized protein (DUF1800 family)
MNKIRSYSVCDPSSVFLRPASIILVFFLFSLASRPAHAATPTLQLVAYSLDGTNTGTGRIGRNVQVNATVSGTTSTAVTWTLQGAGTLTTAGLYTGPAAMPANRSVTVTATLVAFPSVTASYQFVLLNPVPGVASTSPASLPKASTNASVSVWGGDFVAGSTVLLNGVAVPTTFTSSGQLVAQVTIPASASGSLPIAVVNPTPGGGSSNTLQVPVATPAITLTASSIDGTNTGTGRLGLSEQISASVSGTTSTAVTWTLQGAGSISSTGLYTAPTAMPANSAVTITATLGALPSVTASYKLTLVNPVPRITSNMPATLTGTSNAVSLWGVGIVPGSVVLVNGSPVATSVVASNEVTANVSATAGQTAPVSLTIQNPLPGGGISTPLSLPVSVPSGISVLPATFGTGTFTATITGSNFTTASKVFVNGESVPTTYASPTTLTATVFVAPWRTTPVEVGVGNSTAPTNQSSIPVVNQTAVSYDTAARFTMQAAFGPNPTLVAHIQNIGLSAFLTEQFAQAPSVYPPTGSFEDSSRIQFTINALSGNDLLRQRVAFALEEIFAASLFEGNSGMTGVPWQEMMEKDAFGNFRDLMTDVTLNPTMGMWLDLANNWAPTNPNVHPNQNYARELLQLFTIGTVMLNDDGSTVVDGSGNPVESFDDATVLDMSRALTGWALTPPGNAQFALSGTDFSAPLTATDGRHDHGQKVLFDSTTLPAGQTIQQDLKQALDTVFNHPNLPPFISKQLIQHLVKSNPSPAYVERISHVFENDGKGIRGDLPAVVQAILLDPEARSGDSGVIASNDGHLQEPIIYFLAVMNGLGITPAPANDNFVNAEGGLGEYVWQPESVFSFYSPSFNVPGTTINAPEFQIFDGNLLAQRSQILYNIINGTQWGVDFSYKQTGWLVTNFTTVPDLLDAVNHVFYHGTMPAATQAAIASYCATVPASTPQRLCPLYLSLNSDAFQISY